MRGAWNAQHALANEVGEKLWLEEAERRLGELKSGRTVGIPAAKVIRKARSALR